MIMRRAVAAEPRCTARLSARSAIDPGAYFSPLPLQRAENYPRGVLVLRNRTGREESSRVDGRPPVVREACKRVSFARASRAAL